MRYRFTPRFERNIASAPADVVKSFGRQLTRLLENNRYPSLQTHPVPGMPGYFQGRATLHWRFYYYVDGDTYVLTDIFKHKDT